MPSALLKSRLTLTLLALLCLCVFLVPQLDFLKRGAPYESWDEVTIYNNAGALMKEHNKERSYAVYGMIDTSKYVLARWLYERDKGTLEPAFSNNIPQSWQEPGFDAGQIFGYSRGIRDREAILTARKINVLFNYSIASITAVCAIAVLGWNAVGIVLCLVLLMSGAASLQQGAFALPNTANTILAFSIFVFSCFAILRKSIVWLLVATGFLALGINHKFDFMAVGILVASATCYFVVLHWRTPLRVIGIVGGLFAVFSVTLLATNPLSPVTEYRFQVFSVTSLTRNPPNLADNLDKAITSLEHEFSLNSTGWQPEPRSWILLLTLLPLCAFVLPWLAEGLERSRRFSIFACSMLGVIACLAVPILKGNPFYGRYLNNGTAILLASAACGLTLVLLHSKRGTTLWLSRFLLALLLTAAGTRAYRILTVHHDNQALYQELSPELARNNAVKLAAEIAKKQGQPESILVDEHSYFDLAYLRKQGIRVRTINMANLENVVAQLPSGKHLVLFATGDHSSPSSWEGSWPSDIAAQYDKYLARLKALPVIKDFPGNKMMLLSWRPPLADDWVTLSSIERP